jgi:hypothetical protein
MEEMYDDDLNQNPEEIMDIAFDTVPNLQNQVNLQENNPNIDSSNNNNLSSPRSNNMNSNNNVNSENNNANH